ncbi:hypothetical protein IMZ11_04590 [Microtetraspora sp. AC03309]|nr:hypothetical protein [Microtetraspora sp. AC03309]
MSSAEPESALMAVLEAVREGLAVSGAAVDVDVDVDGTLTVAGELGGVSREVPLIWHGERVGLLLLGRRISAGRGERALAALTPYVADAAHAVRLAAALRRSHERVLAALEIAREEERRRLYRDLHDGLGHALAGMAMSINMARISLLTTPASADRLLLGLRSGMDAVSQEIRVLTRGLRPPVLNELGLVGAVRALAAGSSPPAVVRTEGESAELPSAVELAAYRIVQECLTNVRKHAGALSVLVSLRRDPSCLVVRVSDDGRGPAAGPASGTLRAEPPTGSGMGLASMRERAAELGGICVIGPAPGGGTIVEAVLPLGADQSRDACARPHIGAAGPGPIA